MTEYVARRDPKRPPTHPGYLVREIVEEQGYNKTAIAEALGVSRQHLYDIMRERKPVSPAVAVRLGKLFGNGPALWVRMQAAHDVWKAEQEIDVSKIETLTTVKAA